MISESFNLFWLLRFLRLSGFRGVDVIIIKMVFEEQLFVFRQSFEFRDQDLVSMLYCLRVVRRLSNL
ncbi:hypothetical protein HanRHA438_Chr11g0489401 [Helianthus annuus]|nr:hypothetical protein HanRHA438_Chr11g0489401 [Helianthus annuus]